MCTSRTQIPPCTHYMKFSRPGRDHKPIPPTDNAPLMQLSPSGSPLQDGLPCSACKMKGPRRNSPSTAGAMPPGWCSVVGLWVWSGPNQMSPTDAAFGQAELSAQTTGQNK